MTRGGLLWRAPSRCPMDKKVKVQVQKCTSAPRFRSKAAKDVRSAVRLPRGFCFTPPLLHPLAVSAHDLLPPTPRVVAFGALEAPLAKRRSGFGARSQHSLQELGRQGPPDSTGAWRGGRNGRGSPTARGRVGGGTVGASRAGAQGVEGGGWSRGEVTQRWALCRHLGGEGWFRRVSSVLGPPVRLRAQFQRAASLLG